jgi:uncharacterized Tic20 family protein
MAACLSCGADTNAGAHFCPRCGAALGALAGASGAAGASNTAGAAGASNAAGAPGASGAAAFAGAPSGGLTANNWVMLCHLSALAGGLVPGLGHLLGPLIVWLAKKDEIPQVDIEGKEALNFQITMSLYMLISGLLMWVGIGFLMLAAVIVADLILTVVAAVKTSQGTLYRYPFTIRFLR